MAIGFTKTDQTYSRQYYFRYFATASVADNSNMGIALAPDFDYELDLVRLHLSTAHVSVVDFIVTTSHASNSYYNETIISQAMNGVGDVEYRPDTTRKFSYQDGLVFSMLMSAANVYGIEVSGWAVTG